MTVMTAIIIKLKNNHDNNNDTENYNITDIGVIAVKKVFTTTKNNTIINSPFYLFTCRALYKQ